MFILRDTFATCIEIIINIKHILWQIAHFGFLLYQTVYQLAEGVFMIFVDFFKDLFELVSLNTESILHHILLGFYSKTK